MSYQLGSWKRGADVASGAETMLGHPQKWCTRTVSTKGTRGTVYLGKTLPQLEVGMRMARVGVCVEKIGDEGVVASFPVSQVASARRKLSTNTRDLVEVVIPGLASGVPCTRLALMAPQSML